MRYLFMDNQPNNPNTVKQNPITPNPITPKNSENPISILTEIPVSKTELPPLQPQPEIEEVVPSHEYQNEAPIPTISETPITEIELPQPQPEVEPTAPSTEYQNEYQDVLNQYATTQKTTLPVSENEPQPIVPPTLADLGITEKPPQNNIFKIIFIFSLIVFISTATVLAFVFFKNQDNQPTSTPSTVEATQPKSPLVFVL